MGFLHRLFGIPEPQPQIELPPIDDPSFGHLVWESKYRWWTGSLAFPLGGKFELHVDADNDREPLPGELQRKAFLKVRDRLVELRDEAIKEFLPSFNEDWMEGGSYTFDDLVSRLVPESISVASGGEVSLSFAEKENNAEDELFGGHVLRIAILPNGERDVGLEG